MSAIAIIPARGGSRRLPKKNIRLFHGKPIIAYSIEAAKASGLFDRIIVSSDHSEIIDIGMEYGATDYHDRSDELAADEVGTQEVMQHIVAEMDERPELFCCIYATAPLMSVIDLIRGHDALLEEHWQSYTMSVGTKPLCDAAQFYWGRPTAFGFGVDLIDEHTTMIPIAPGRVCDINTEEDWKRAEEMYARLQDLKINHPEIKKPGEITWL